MMMMKKEIRVDYTDVHPVLVHNITTPAAYTIDSTKQIYNRIKTATRAARGYKH